MANFILAPIFGAATNLVLALFVYLQQPRHRLNQVYLAWGLALAIWCGGASALFFVHTQEWAEFWARFVHMGVIWIPVTGLHVSLLVARVRLKRYLAACYAVTVLLTIGNVVNVHIAGVQRLDYGWFARAGWGFWIFTVVMPCITIPAVFVLLRSRRRAARDRKRKYTTLAAANLLLMVVGTHDLGPVLGWTHYPFTTIPVYPWGTYAAGFYGLIVGYGVLQDQVLDVRVTLSKYVAFVVRLVFFFAVGFLLLFVFAVVGPKSAISLYAFCTALAVMLLAGAVTGLLFPKLFGGAGERLERRLLGDNFEYQEQLQRLADTVHRHGNLQGMWTEVSDVLHGAVRSSPVCCVLLGARRFAVAFHGVAPMDDAAGLHLQRLGADCALLKYLQRQPERSLDVNHEPLLSAISGETRLLMDARTEARSLCAEYVFALGGTDRVIGFLSVGPKRDGTPFTASDLELLDRLAQRIGWATERTVLGEQLAMAQRHELLSMMSRGLAHDLNNLLTPVSTVIQLSAGQYRTGSNEDQLLEAAENSVRVIRDYVEEAIFFAKDLQPRMTRLDLGVLLNDVRSVVENRAARKGVEVRWKAGEGSFVGDGVLCQRLLSNLVNNAIDASAAGQEVRVEARVDILRNIARFIVSDDGTGIPLEQQSLVFQPYFTTKDSGDHNEQRGFGLGLTVCQLIVELHQGVITLQSDVGKGTRVAVELPLEGAGPPAFVPKHVPI